VPVAVPVSGRNRRYAAARDRHREVANAATFLNSRTQSSPFSSSSSSLIIPRSVVRVHAPPFTKTALDAGFRPISFPGRLQGPRRIDISTAFAHAGRFAARHGPDRFPPVPPDGRTGRETSPRAAPTHHQRAVLGVDPAARCAGVVCVNGCCRRARSRRWSSTARSERTAARRVAESAIVELGPLVEHALGTHSESCSSWRAQSVWTSRSKPCRIGPLRGVSPREFSRFFRGGGGFDSHPSPPQPPASMGVSPVVLSASRSPLS
jgi:hypothetical protein